jgi:hypothetical protein
MTRRIMWISMAAVLAVASAAQPWNSGSAIAGPGPAAKTSTAGAVAPCKDEVTQLRAQLAAEQTAKASLQAQLDKLQTAERQRQAKLQAQLGAPIAEKLR